MNSLEKEFVSYELALRMKQLGFDKSCFAFYNGKHIDLGVWDWEYPAGEKRRDIGECPQAPTFSQAFDWFEDTFQLYPSIVIDRTSYPKYAYEIANFFGNPKDLAEKEWGWNEMIFSPYLYRTKREARTECLEKLIEIVSLKYLNV
jgi:hypothetical protein